MKKKTYIAAYSVIAALVIGATGFQIYSTNRRAWENKNVIEDKSVLESETYSGDLVQTIEGTSVDMLSPEFWIRDRGSEILFSQEEIEDFNKNNPSFVEYYDEEQSRNLKLFMDDLPDSIPGDVVRSLMGTEVDVDIPDAVIPQYAICVERSVAKTLPSDEFVSDDPDEIFFNDLISAEVMPFTGVVVLSESRDGEWSYVLAGTFLGWVKKDTLAMCKDKDQWLSISQPEDFLVVTGSEIVMDETAEPTHSSGMILPMGTRVKLADDMRSDHDKADEDMDSASDETDVADEKTSSAGTNESEFGNAAYENAGGQSGIEIVNGRSTIGSYVVEVPYRDDDGFVQMEKTLIPVSKDVHVGFMTMTSESVIRQAFKFLGRVYGYGGSLSSNDCSGFIRQVYSCYGLDLPRNATAIAQRSDLGSIECSVMTSDKKKSIIAEMTPGLPLYMEGHIMMYLGTEEGEPYVISSCATCIEPGHDASDIVEAYCVFVSGLDLVRASGETWLESINYILWKEY